jgi:thiopeptide-type bacteriocin biosynthesis protein
VARAHEFPYQHQGLGLLRAARIAIASTDGDFPDLNGGSADARRSWLIRAWTRDDLITAIGLASPSLARQVQRICDGEVTRPADVRRAAVSVTRYLVRESGRPTPFGLFAGVAEVTFGPTTKVRWGDRHRLAIRADSEWLAEVIALLESCPELLFRLTVVFNTLARVRIDRLSLPRGRGHAEIPYSAAIKAACEAACSPITVGALVDRLITQFPTMSRQPISEMVRKLVAEGFLVTGLRAPSIVQDSMGHLLQQLDIAQTDQLPPVAPLLYELRAIHAQMAAFNRSASEHGGVRHDALPRRMQALARTPRSPLAADLYLDTEVELPESVGREMEAAASILLRLTARPLGHEIWRDYLATFLDRYGTGTLVPLLDLLDPDRGLGFPASYPGSSFALPTGRPDVPERDKRLLALLYEAALGGHDEIVLDDDVVGQLQPHNISHARTPPHIELSARIRARSVADLDCGDYSLVVRPARAAGRMTGRFVNERHQALGKVLAILPSGDANAVPAQLSFPPSYTHADNIMRVRQLVPHVISLGEHPGPCPADYVGLDDLAVTADDGRLLLVRISDGRCVEPQTFHALALEKQAPPIVRVLANLPRAFTTDYTSFDWGSAAEFRRLPRVRYGRCVLALAQWRIPAADLPDQTARWEDWRASLKDWGRRYRLPDLIELRDDDRMLRLDLTIDAHAALLREQLAKVDDVVLVEGDEAEQYGWLDGHAHEIAVPLVAAQAPSFTSEGVGDRVLLSPATHGDLPASPGKSWFFAKLFMHPDQQTRVVAWYFPQLMDDLTKVLGRRPQWWFIRYRSPHEPNHLRLRISVSDGSEYAACASAAGLLASRLRTAGILQRLELDTYYPEVGRYGTGDAMAAAERVFAADSRVVLPQLLVPAQDAYPVALVAANLADIARSYAGDDGIGWLIAHGRNDQSAPASTHVRDQALLLADQAALAGLSGGGDIAQAWQERREALAVYRRMLQGTPQGMSDPDSVLNSLLHMHHIRAIGLDRVSERLCRRLARAIAISWKHWENN